jgi:hypothetical protein
MKNLDFPVSAGAVRLHGREFHAQDFLDVSSAPVGLPGGSRSGGAVAQERHDDPALFDVYNERRPSARARLRAVLRWTLVCMTLALAAAVTMSWLVRSDLQYGKWSESTAGTGTDTGVVVKR